jgi:hypothetical protein
MWVGGMLPVCVFRLYPAICADLQGRGRNKRLFRDWGFIGEMEGDVKGNITCCGIYLYVVLAH